MRGRDLLRSDVAPPTNGHYQIVESVTEQLCRPESYAEVMHRANHEVPMPSVEALEHFMETISAVLFPGYFGPSELGPSNMRYYTAYLLDSAYRILQEQTVRGHCFACQGDRAQCDDRESTARTATDRFFEMIPTIRRVLATDVEAAFEGDPAAKSPGETIFCYPSIRALTHYRVAHALSSLDVPLIPRIITESAHSSTGIDIHPGAVIDEYFFMDHGTGIVIGETCEIGKHVRIYQGVTLGAKSFPLDEEGKPVKGIPRHPIVEDDVTIYAGATCLGRITIGKGAVIGGNVWVTRDVQPGAQIAQRRYNDQSFKDGAGI